MRGIILEQKEWNPEECAVFFRSRERHGDLSNMTAGFSLKVNGMDFQGPEGLYQALKFPEHPALQREIGRERSGMEAKKTAYAHRTGFHPKWDGVKLDAMAFTLGIKLLQHPRRFGDALRQTGERYIVERSRRDAWWGAMPRGNRLYGTNVLGRTLTLLRDLWLEEEEDAAKAAGRLIARAELSSLQLDGKPLLRRREEEEDLWALTAEMSRRHGLGAVAAALQCLPDQQRAEETGKLLNFIRKANDRRLSEGVNPNISVSLEAEYLEKHPIPQVARKSMERQESEARARAEAGR